MDKTGVAMIVFYSILVTIVIVVILGMIDTKVIDTQYFCNKDRGLVFEHEKSFLIDDTDFRFMSVSEYNQYCKENK